jgi:hypothetical protein
VGEADGVATRKQCAHTQEGGVVRWADTWLRRRWCRQGRSRHSTITLEGAKSSGGPLARYLVLPPSAAAARHCYTCPLVPLRLIKTAMLVTVTSHHDSMPKVQSDSLRVELPCRRLRHMAANQDALSRAAACAGSGKPGRVHHHSHCQLRLNTTGAELGSRVCLFRIQSALSAFEARPRPCFT